MIVMHLSLAFDSALIFWVDTKGTLHKFTNKEYACDICFTGVLMKNQNVWVITPCQLVNSYHCH
jgi:hypothetical protein